MTYREIYNLLYPKYFWSVDKVSIFGKDYLVFSSRNKPLDNVFIAIPLDDYKEDAECNSTIMELVKKYTDYK